MVVAEMVEQLLPNPEVYSSNPISKVTEQFSAYYNLQKSKIKEKEAGNGSSF